MKEVIGDKVRKYLIVTCPFCKESYRIDWKEIAQLAYTPANGEPEDFHIICPWCEKETPDSFLRFANTFQIIRED